MFLFLSVPASSEPSIFDDEAISGAGALVLQVGDELDAACAFLKAWPASSRRVPLHVEVPPFSSRRTEEALRALIPLHPDAVHLGACETAAEIQKLDVLMSVHEAEAERASDPALIFAEFGTTASGILAPGSYKNRSRRLAGLILNPQALIDHLGLAPGETADDLLRLARSMTLLKAREAEVPAFIAATIGASGRAAGLRKAEADGFSGLIAR